MRSVYVKMSWRMLFVVVVVVKLILYLHFNIIIYYWSLSIEFIYSFIYTISDYNIILCFSFNIFINILYYIYYIILIYAFDQHLNMILGDVEETVTLIEVDNKTDEEIIKKQIRRVGMLFVRGDIIVLVSPPLRA